MGIDSLKKIYILALFLKASRLLIRLRTFGRLLPSATSTRKGSSVEGGDDVGVSLPEGEDGEGSEDP